MRVDNPNLHGPLWWIYAGVLVAFWIGTYKDALTDSTTRTLWARTAVIAMFFPVLVIEEENFSSVIELIALGMCWSHWVGLFTALVYGDGRFKRYKR